MRDHSQTYMVLSTLHNADDHNAEKMVLKRIHFLQLLDCISFSSFSFKVKEL